MACLNEYDFTLLSTEDNEVRVCGVVDENENFIIPPDTGIVSISTIKVTAFNFKDQSQTGEFFIQNCPTPTGNVNFTNTGTSGPNTVADVTFTFTNVSTQECSVEIRDAQGCTISTQAIGATYHIDSVPGNVYIFRCILTDDCGNTYSSEYSVTIPADPGDFVDSVLTLVQTNTVLTYYTLDTDNCLVLNQNAFGLTSETTSIPTELQDSVWGVRLTITYIDEQSNTQVINVTRCIYLFKNTTCKVAQLVKKGNFTNVEIIAIFEAIKIASEEDLCCQAVKLCEYLELLLQDVPICGCNC